MTILRTLHAWRTRSTATAPLLVALTLLPAGGCLSYGPPAATSVAQGKYFAAGNPDYDEFFVRLYRLQVGLAQAPDALARARSGLAARLGLPLKADSAALQASLAERARELRSRGLPLHVETKGSPATTTLHASGTKSGADAELVSALEEAVAALDRTQAELPGWRKELEELPPRGVVLESGIEAAFIGTSRAHRSDVRQNLADAQKIMGLMGARLKDLEETSNDLAQTLATALPAPAPAPEPSVPAADPEEAKPKLRGPRPARPTPAKPPAKPASPSNTGEAPPPPKPVQGTAKPDFEP